MEKSITLDNVPIPTRPLTPPNTGFLSSISSSLTENIVASSIKDVFAAFSDRRAALGLSNPGTVDGIAKEVQRDVFLNNLMFTGLRADLTKALGAQPLFQTAHNLTMGSEGMPPYSFAALYGSPKVFLQGNIDNDYQLSARANYRWSSSFVTKSNVQIVPGGAGRAMFQLESDYTGADFSANLKAMNPSILEGSLTGIIVGSYLQSITPQLALGLEAMWQRTAAEQGPETAISYAARYKGKDWIGSAQLLAQGGIQASYWKRLSDRVEAGADISLSFLGLSGAANPMLGMRNEGVATLGAKYDFRGSVFRGQIDSQGKVSAVFEKRLAPPVQLTFAGELDHAKNTTRIGLAISVESMVEEFQEQQERVMSSVDQQSPPF